MALHELKYRPSERGVHTSERDLRTSPSPEIGLSVMEWQDSPRLEKAQAQSSPWR